MRKYLILFVVFVGVGSILYYMYPYGAEDTSWICMAGTWSVIQKTDDPVPQEPCEGVKTVFLDVRTQEEWNEGHIKGALHFDLQRLEGGEFPDISQDTNIQIYCRSGNRAGTAVNILKQKGFTNVLNVGGLTALVDAGYPIE